MIEITDDELDTLPWYSCVKFEVRMRQLEGKTKSYLNSDNYFKCSFFFVLFFCVHSTSLTF